MKEPLYRIRWTQNYDGASGVGTASYPKAQAEMIRDNQNRENDRESVGIVLTIEIVPEKEPT